MRIVCLSTSVGALGSGIGGGVELTLRTLATGLTAYGHSVTVVAPRGSVVSGIRVIEVDGALHVSSQTLNRSPSPAVPVDSVLVNMWQQVIAIVARGECDIVLNFAYDTLPFLAAADCAVPVAHLVSMSSMSDEMDTAVRNAAVSTPGCIAMHSRAQAATFGDAIAQQTTVVASGIDVDAYDFVDHSSDDLAFVGRIAAEKGIEDVFAVSALTKRNVRAFGVMEQPAVWQQAQRLFPSARVEHAGFLSTHDLQHELGRCAAMLMVHRWVEAFGNVAIEALACGVPVITYDRGGPAEIVRPGLTGFVVPADDIAAVAAAVAHIGTIQRSNCRADVVERFSASAFVGRIEAWLSALLKQ